jgi:hypothetical protein
MAFINDRNIATDTLICDKVISDPSKGTSVVTIQGAVLSGSPTLNSPSVTSPTISGAVETAPVRRDEIAPVGVTATALAPGVSASGSIYVFTPATTQVVTLPAVAAGLVYTFICDNAGGEIQIVPATTQFITGKGFVSSTGIKNAAASNAVGDTVRLVGSADALIPGWWADIVTGGWVTT